MDILFIYPVYICVSFSIASFFTACFFKQRFQLFLAISLFFVTIDVLLFIINLISIYIFLAILLVLVLLLVGRYFLLK